MDVYRIPISLQIAIDKVNDGDDLTDGETREWLEYYLFIISDNHTLSVKEMLSDHDWWLKRIEYHSGIREEKMAEFRLKCSEDMPLDDFLETIITFFTLEELASSGLF